MILCFNVHLMSQIGVLIKVFTFSLLYLCGIFQSCFDILQSLHFMLLLFLGDWKPSVWLWMGSCCSSQNCVLLEFVRSVEWISLWQSMFAKFKYKAYCACLSNFTINLSDSNAKYKMSNFLRKIPSFENL